MYSFKMVQFDLPAILEFFESSIQLPIYRIELLIFQEHLLAKY